MAAAEYYGYQPDYGDDNRRREENRSPLSPLSPLSPHSNHPGELQHKPSLTSSLTLPHTNPSSPYAVTSNDDLIDPPYGGSSSQHAFATDTSYNPHNQRDSTASIATQSKLYADPYAENIPLNTHRPSMPSPGQSFSSLPPVESALPPPGDKRRPPRLPQPVKRRPWFCWILTIIQVSVFIGEIVRNAVLTGSPIAIKPSFNPMIGPSPYVQINMGGRYVLCMQYTAQLWQDENGNPIEGPVSFPCPWTTKNDANCTLAQHCGFSGVPTQEEMVRDRVGPNQWYRFIIPIFLHAGLIHIGFNMLLQLRLGVDMEREIGPLRFALVYFSSGIFGFILGGNFAPRLVVSTGASGCLFGVLALVLLDLLYTWKERLKPKSELAWLMVDIVISFILGLLPGLDNFAHIGGFVMGLMLGLTVLHSPKALQRRIGSEVPYSPMATTGFKGSGGKAAGFLKNPVGFFKGRKGMWWAWWLVRAGMLTCAVVATSLLLRWFYTSRVECEWCMYLSCLPISNWCEIGNLDNSMRYSNSTTS
ncbi:hypothetical protein EV426DRAFT_225036 [Tirmania nivea]|nr:hypothetical protein EV426DRAFT_225036 [Tirmania nivea]